MEDFYFKRPKEAPVFEPTADEFEDPLGYIAKIRPIAEKIGICKIRPPKGWKPPFSVDFKTFKFTPRVQKLNELEAQTRVKLNFHDKLARFWELQGNRLRIPNVNRKLLDLHKLHKCVNEAGGFEAVCREKKWSLIAKQLSFGDSAVAVCGTLKINYEKFLLPYDLFCSGEALNFKVEVDYSTNKELRKLRFSCPGPKAKIPPLKPVNKPSTRSSGATNSKTGIVITPEKAKTETITKKKKKNIPKVDQYMCYVCGGGDDEDKLLLCDVCDAPYHTYCLIPKLSDVPKGDWRCPPCLAEVYHQPPAEFGFDQSKRQYSLDEFGDMADKFKAEFFNKLIYNVTSEEVERWFWFLVGSLRSDVCVEYGADISAGDVGSGFPTRGRRRLTEDEGMYADSQWNLNNLSVLEKSSLRFIDANISGMKVPWCYVGMCFSSFCWHIEDHWSYSINFLHRGEPKTWYGVSSQQADLFESVMRERAPELFEQSPDLLHHITTILNPNVLMDRGVSVHRTDQRAGEFVITFPRAYHAGFNQGFNFAEAVNFCPSDWLSFGGACVEHYADLGRPCVFSHDELVCKMASSPDGLDPDTLSCVHIELEKIQAREKTMRKGVLVEGIRCTGREAFENLNDDDRTCDHCKTTIFMSALSCSCTPKKLVCLSHFSSLCACTNEGKLLKYRYSMDEISTLIRTVKSHLDKYTEWINTAHRVIDEFENPKRVEEKDSVDEEERPSLEDVQALVSTGLEKKYPRDLIVGLQEVVTHVRRCVGACQELLVLDSRRRTRARGREVKKLSMEDLDDFFAQLETLPCRVPEQASLKELSERIGKWQDEAREQFLAPERDQLRKLIEFADGLAVELPEARELALLLERVEWLKKVASAFSEPDELELSGISKLLSEGVLLTQNDQMENAMVRLRRVLTAGEDIEAKALNILRGRQGEYAIFQVQSVVQEGSQLECRLPNVARLQEIFEEAQQILRELDDMHQAHGQSLYPLLDTVVDLLERSQRLPISFPRTKELETAVSYIENWRETASRLFLKKNSSYTLLEVLLPRSVTSLDQLTNRTRGSITSPPDGQGNKRARKTGAASKSDEVAASRENTQAYERKWREHGSNSEQICSDMYMTMTESEIAAMRRFRQANMSKAETKDQDALTYCLCRRAGVRGMMIQCELCRDWFHGQCVSLPKSDKLREVKYLCPLCERSHRPDLTHTLVDLMKQICLDVTIRFPEMEALQLLMNRAMMFQQRVYHILRRDRELRNAFADYKRIMDIRPGIRSGKAMDMQDWQGLTAAGKKHSRKSPHHPRGPTTTGAQGFFQPHPHQRQDPCPSSNSSVSGKEAVSKEVMNLHFVMSPPARSELENLIMEGDLLEVSVPETVYLWDLYQGAISVPQVPPETIPIKTEAQKMPSKTPGPSGSARQRHSSRGSLHSSINSKDLPRTAKIASIRNRQNSGSDHPRQCKRSPSSQESSVTDISDDSNDSRSLTISSSTGSSSESRNSSFCMDSQPLTTKPTVKRKAEDTRKSVHSKRSRVAPRPQSKSRVKTVAKKVPPTEKAKVVKKEEKSVVSKPSAPRRRKQVCNDDCQAEVCCQPPDENVDWVQCDKCTCWFHWICVGIFSDDQITGDYMCPLCIKKEAPDSVDMAEHTPPNETQVVPKQEKVSEDLLSLSHLALELKSSLRGRISDSEDMGHDAVSEDEMETASLLPAHMTSSGVEGVNPHMTSSGVEGVYSETADAEGAQLIYLNSKPVVENEEEVQPVSLNTSSVVEKEDVSPVTTASEAVQLLSFLSNSCSSMNLKEEELMPLVRETEDEMDDYGDPPELEQQEDTGGPSGDSHSGQS